ncbi:MAG: DinB family protein, partial [Maribacter sp.]
MKKIILPIVLLALVGFGVITSGLTDAERKMAVAELTRTQDRFTSTLEGLSTEELNYKSTPESWSIAECAEHLAISEGMIGGMLTGALKTPADPSKRDSVLI